MRSATETFVFSDIVVYLLADIRQGVNYHKDFEHFLLDALVVGMQTKNAVITVHQVDLCYFYISKNVAIPISAVFVAAALNKC